MILLQVSRRSCLYEAARQVSYLVAQSLKGAQPSPPSSPGAQPSPEALPSPPFPSEALSLSPEGAPILLPQQSDEPLMQQFWEVCCREADVMLSRFRVGPCQGGMERDYVVRLHMPPAFDPGLAPMLSGLLYTFFSTFIAAALMRTILPSEAPAFELRAEQHRQRLREALHLRRRPIRRPPTVF